ncbi:hypothetical protein NM688_g2346 [Phlebia brevispora]|uniref:Uncharacterized protein n=1 Tax=Phlebia brevispora TaxID=194682 RepID=A0ACC1T8X4_9APHY|nr:hypothetical protein NM688_g2346 [Phlebia brevispora]
MTSHNTPATNAEHRVYTTGCRCQRPLNGRKGRNLVVCIDGTSNRFNEDMKVTNVIKLYNLTEKNEQQLTFYNSGIGTYARPSTFSPKHFLKVCSHIFDQAIARRFEPIVLDAYRWLSDHYEVGDRIYLFGFSRGAYQVRVLSAMIDRVGLIHKGNTKQIPFAYELYERLQDRTQDEPSTGPTSPKREHASDDNEKSVGQNVQEADLKKRSSSASIIPETPQPQLSRIDVSTLSHSPETAVEQGPSRRESFARKDQKKPAELVFKETFCREVNVHFVGAWDTVSSVGIMRGESHPDATSGMRHVCYFRHALALDERRVKFLPEYVHGGEGPWPKEAEGHHPHTKEVWFSGTHSDVGGTTSAVEHSPSLLWMVMEAAHAGLRMDHLKFDKPPEPEKPKEGGAPASLRKYTESLKGIWWLLEYIPVKQLAYKDKGTTARKIHMGRGRMIVKNQKIHESVFEDLNSTDARRAPAARLSVGGSIINVWEQSQAPSIDIKSLIEPHQQDALETLRRAARSETGKLALVQAGISNVLQKLPITENGDIHLKDLHAIRDIFDEVYDGRIPEKLLYSQVQPLVSHILAHGMHHDFEFARNFVLEFTDFPPGTIQETLIRPTAHFFSAVSIRVFHKLDRDSPVIYASFLPNSNSNHVTAASEDGRIRIWNVRDDRKVFGFPQKEKIKSFACSPDGRYAVSTSYTDKLFLWDLSEQKCCWEGSVPRGILGPVNFSAHDTLVISSFENDNMLIWEVNPKDLKERGILEIQSPGKLAAQHDIAEEEQALLNASHLQLYGANRQQLGEELFEEKLNDVTCVAFSQDGLLAACGRGKAEVNPRSSSGNGKQKRGAKNTLISVFWRVQSGHEKFKHLVTLLGDKGSRGTIKTLVFAPNGRHLIAGGSDNHIRIWATDKWYEEVDIDEHDGDVNAVAVSEDSERIVSCSDDGTVRVWDASVLLKGPCLDEHDFSPEKCFSHEEPDPNGDEEVLQTTSADEYLENATDDEEDAME